jgi:asparagine synthase (glutamine-hydrolysing)
MTLIKEEYVNVIPELRTLINKVVQKNMADGILFSAGTDTTLIAYEAMKYKPNLFGMSLAFKHGIAKDAPYIKIMVDFLEMKHETHIFDGEEALLASPKVVEALKTFDPMEVRNSLPVYIGLTLMKQKGVKSLFTGDGVDELFGYPWLFHLSDEELQKRLESMWAEMTFSSIPMGQSLGIDIKTPFLDREFMEYAKKLPLKLKVNMENGVKFGKWILRKAYENDIPKEVIWRPKAPLEAGTGTDVLRTYFNRQFTEQEFEELKKQILAADNVKIQDKEQLIYYQAFRKRFGKPSDVYTSEVGAIECPYCKGHLKTKISFCKICGAYPI